MRLTDLSALDRSQWRPIHTRILLALGIGWALDAFEIQIIGSVIKPIAAEFSLTTTDQTVWVWLVWFVGLMSGALIFGSLADRFGRKRMFVATLVLYSTAAILTASSWSFASFLVFRFATGLGVGGEYSAVSSAIAEFMPARLRGRTHTLVINFWSIGGIVAGLVGIVFISAILGPSGWRFAFLFGAVTALYGLYARRLIPESPRWLVTKGRVAEAAEVIQQVTGTPWEEAAGDIERRARLGEQLRELWRDHRGKLAFGMALDFAEAAGYYGLFTFMPVFVLTKGVVDVGAGSVPWYYVVANVGGLAGGLLTSWALDRYGRKPTVLVGYTVAAGSMLAVALAASSGSPGWTLVAFTFAVFCASCAWMSAYPTFSELFPTHLRATGVGVSVGFGRIGAIVGVVVLAEVATSFGGLWPAFLCLSGLWLIGTAAAAVWWFWGVEARGATLEVLAAA